MHRPNGRRSSARCRPHRQERRRAGGGRGLGQLETGPEALAATGLAVGHFGTSAAAIRAQEGALSQIDEDTVAYHFHEPLGVVGQIIPWNFPS